MKLAPLWLGSCPLLCALFCVSIGAEQVTTTAAAATPNAQVIASARLDFTVNIDKFIYFRIGTGGAFTGGTSGTGPAANGTVDSVNFVLGTTIPGGAAPANGNNVASTWDGTAPAFVVSSSSGTVVPVEIRSNAGQVRITATPNVLLTSGANTLPMSQISITSSNANLPAPVVPNSGVSASVNVSTGGTGTGAAPALLTYYTANWTFAYANTVNAAAGVYNGQITFTAAAP
jgi:hypothetical protein